MKKRIYDIRDILADHADTQARLWLAVRVLSQEHIIDSLTYDSQASGILVRAMIHTEKAAAEEIERLYVGSLREHPFGSKPDSAIQCKDCGSWTVGEYCQCAYEGHQLECVCADCSGAELTARND